MTGIPFIEPERVAARIQHRIMRPPAVNPHIGIMGRSGTGKDHVSRWLLETIRPMERTIVLDINYPDGDQVWDGWGNDVSQLPGHLEDLRYRVIVPMGSDGRANAEQVLEYAYRVRNVILVLSDIGHITEHQDSRRGMGLGGLVNRLMSEGRKHRVSVMALSTSASWAESGFKDQPAAFLLGQTTGEMTERFAKIARLPRDAKIALETLPPREFVYIDYVDGRATIARTKAPNKNDTR